jgi:hypothetical protein
MTVAKSAAELAFDRTVVDRVIAFLDALEVDDSDEG